MPVLVVANPKGGAGKSTVATQMAGYWASRGHRVMLGDADRQQSARLWLSLRSPALPQIAGWKIGADGVARPPAGTTHVVVDTPAGLHGQRFQQLLRCADSLLVPVQPSVFDIYAVQDFLDRIKEQRKLQKLRIGLIGVRVDERTRAAEQLREFLRGLAYPLLGMLRSTTNYSHMAAQGLSLWDLRAAQAERDLQQWQDILSWADASA